MKSIFVQVGFDVTRETENEAIQEALEIERLLLEKYDNQAAILQANETNGIGVGKSLLTEVRKARGEYYDKL